MKKWNELRDRIPAERRLVTDERVDAARMEKALSGLRGDMLAGGCPAEAGDLAGLLPASDADAKRRAVLRKLAAHDQELGL